MSRLERICRLCKATEFLQDLFSLQENSSLVLQVNICTGLEIQPEDNLPKMICKSCVRKIKKFYTFKQSCLRVNEELKLESKNNICKFELFRSLGETCRSFNFDPLDPIKDDQNQHKEITINSNINSKKFTELENETIFSEETKVSETKFETIENNILSKKDYVLNNTSDATGNIEDPGILQCEQCGSIFNTKEEFKIHLSTHNNTKLFQCKYCPKQFTRAETQRIHTRSHLGIKPYMCEICGRSSTKLQDLIRHMKIHSDERNHKCDTCGRCFKRSADLISHIRTHSGARPYKCYLCDKDYTSHSGLKKHYKMHFKQELDL